MQNKMRVETKVTTKDGDREMKTKMKVKVDIKKKVDIKNKVEWEMCSVLECGSALQAAAMSGVNIVLICCDRVLLCLL